MLQVSFRVFTVIAASAAFAVAGAPAADPTSLPETPKKPVTDVHHGVQVVDNYRWLEDRDDPAVRQWTEQQTAFTRRHLDQIAALPKLRERLKELMADPQPRYSELKWSGDTLFALKDQPPAEQPALVAMKSANEPQSAKVVLDPAQLDPTGKTTIDFYYPSPDGKLVALSLSKAGSEDGTLHVYDVASGKRLSDLIPRVNYATAGGSVAWNRDSSGFFYTRLPGEGERPTEDLNFYQQVYYHKLGAPADQDSYALGKELPRIAEVFLDASPDNRSFLATIQNGDSGEFAHFLCDERGQWKQLTKFGDQINAVAFGVGDDRSLYFVTYQDTPRGQILRTPLDKPDFKNGALVVPQSDVAIVGLQWQGTRMVATLVPTARGLYVLGSNGGPSEVRCVPPAGGRPLQLPLPPVCAVHEIVPVREGAVLLHIGTYTEPAAWYEFRPGDMVLRKTPLRRKAPASFDDIEVTRVTATSKDGTKVPMTVMYPRGLKLDGSNPALLYGYGGYGISMTPSYDARRRIWFDHGGVYAIANIRGGSEYGQSWHTQAMLTGRQRAYDDFYACAKLLVDQHYTSPQRMAIEGGSNGGLLMGVELTQHPELFRAVVSHVGIYDMLRSELSANGTFNIPEFGTVKESDQFKALYAYSPLHHVKPGTAYPAVLLLTGVNDGRVDPANSYKMAATLQAATSSKNPILLRVTFNSGHGLGESLSEEIDQSADVYAFLFEQLGMKY